MRSSVTFSEDTAPVKLPAIKFFTINLVSNTLIINISLTSQRLAYTKVS